MFLLCQRQSLFNFKVNLVNFVNWCKLTFRSSSSKMTFRLAKSQHQKSLWLLSSKELVIITLAAQQWRDDKIVHMGWVNFNPTYKTISISPDMLTVKIFNQALDLQLSSVASLKMSPEFAEFLCRRRQWLMRYFPESSLSSVEASISSYLQKGVNIDPFLPCIQICSWLLAV